MQKGGVRGRRPCRIAASSCPSEEACDQGQDQKGEEDEEQNLRDAGGCTGNTAEAEQAGNKGDHEKDDSIVQHFQSPCYVAEETESIRKGSRERRATELICYTFHSSKTMPPQPFSCGGMSGD